MTDKTLLKEYKSTISDLTKEKQELNEIIDLYEQIDSFYENQLLAGKINN